LGESTKEKKAAEANANAMPTKQITDNKAKGYTNDARSVLS